MSQTVTNIIKWVALPVLLIASILTRYAASYEGLVDLVICLGAVIYAHRLVWLKEYFWSAGFVAIAIVFSPFALALKIFLLLGFTCIAMVALLLRVFPHATVAAVGPKKVKREDPSFHSGVATLERRS